MALSEVIGHDAFADVYRDLRALSAWHLSQANDSITLDATDILHEAVHRILKQKNRSFKDKAYFISICSLMMRRVLVNYIHQRNALKRKGNRDAIRIGLDHISLPALKVVEFLAIHEALSKLESLSWRQARIVEMKYFGGLGTDDIATVLELSQRTVQVEWKHAKIWLKRELEHE
ncbi:MAG: ECF-type sigma factor [Phycisphaerales bacterium]